MWCGSRCDVRLICSPGRPFTYTLCCVVSKKWRQRKIRKERTNQIFTKPRCFGTEVAFTFNTLDTIIQQPYNSELSHGNPIHTYLQVCYCQHSISAQILTHIWPNCNTVHLIKMTHGHPIIKDSCSTLYSFVSHYCGIYLMQILQMNVGDLN